jgi:hypothetical protein
MQTVRVSSQQRPMWRKSRQSTWWLLQRPGPSPSSPTIPASASQLPPPSPLWPPFRSSFKQSGDCAATIPARILSQEPLMDSAYAEAALGPLVASSVSQCMCWWDSLCIMLLVATTVCVCTRSVLLGPACCTSGVVASRNGASRTASFQTTSP